MRSAWLVLGALAAVGCSMEVGAQAAPIVSGRVATAAEVYGTVAIPIGEIDPAYEPDLCTGTLVRPNVVMAAAHCFFQADLAGNPTADLEPVANFRVAAGVGSLFDATGDQLYGVTRFAVHPGYDNVNGSEELGPEVDDIALMVLDRDVTQVAVVPLLGLDERDQLAEGTTVTISGYGASALDRDGPYDAGELRIAEVGVATLAATEMLLVGAAGQDTCPGDSGGPVYLFVDGAPRVVGITSRGDPNATAECGEGGIYTLPHAFEGWIEREVGPPPSADEGGCAVRPARSPRGLPLLVLGIAALVIRAGRRRAR